MERNLVTIRKISELRSIPDADAIETAVVDGWTVVVKKGQFNPGDFAFYFEIDSFLPTDREEFAFLAPKNGKKTVYNGIEGHRLRTIKLRKQLSQGLLIPFDYKKDFEPCGWLVDPTNHCVVATDPNKLLPSGFAGETLTDYFGVQKWEAPVPAQLAGTVRSTFPTHIIPKTDQERVQNLVSDLKRRMQNLPDEEFEVTVKLDGSSMTVFKNGDDVGVCSRNMDLKETEDNTFWKVAKESGAIEWLKNSDANYALQGELIGEGIQGNPENIKGQKFFVFDIYDIDSKRYLSSTERTALWPLDHTPIITTLKLKDIEPHNIGSNFIECILNMAEGPSLNPNTNREGLVFKSINDPSFSFKVISNTYLLNEK